MKRLPSVDVAIVGGGWTGLLMAKELASRTALSVVVLERGGLRSSVAYQDHMDELDYGIRFRAMQDVAIETVTLRHSMQDRALPMRQLGSFLPGSGVGGAGEHWGAQSYRYLPDVFQLLTRTREKYGQKRLPEDHAIRDWGVTYEELEPYYTRAERMLGVCGKAGNLKGRLFEGGNPFEAPRSEEYPCPPIKVPYLTALFADAAKSEGYHPYPIPGATLSRTYTNPDGITRTPCAFCGYCSGFGCMIGAKAQPTNTLLPILNRLKTFKLRTGSWARRVVVKSGRAVGIQYSDEKGNEFFQPAELVLLASFTVNNTRLLLLSRIGEPYNPQTGKGVVGSNFTHQVSIAAATLFFDAPLNRFMGAGAAGHTISDFDGDVFDHRELPFLRGGLLHVSVVGSHPIGGFGRLPVGFKAKWGSEWKKASLYYYDLMGQINFGGEHLAYKGNYVDLDPVYKDKYGDPLLRLTLDWRENERRMCEFVTQKALEIGRAMGAREMTPFPGLKRYDGTRYQGTHLQGGTIMGTSPADSVLNTYAQHWQVPNLFVVGASAFPQNPAPNPTLTVLALAYRTADAVIDRYLKQPGILV